MKKLILLLSVGLGLSQFGFANSVEHYPFNEAVKQAVADGFLDGSVRFHLAGKTPKAKVIQADVVTNKKTNAFLKNHADVCDHVLRSALLQLQETAKKNGATQVGNIVSYFKKNIYKSDVNYECHVGSHVGGVALKGDLLQ